ncbi:hypothetical protein BS50DRAFT_202542 [Corynespora cassiicola Philippines]|uniref:Uncharacterized protein n=1 Tax=Corynespora cassiicola Philippines TaxID=1448308 RepID=A0A2T2N568_CORCC|nr:hypothetical protein BS50DRAFT_202542 [Corynespora cassiicola Philippines]
MGRGNGNEQALEAQGNMSALFLSAPPFFFPSIILLVVGFPKAFVPFWWGRGGKGVCRYCVTFIMYGRNSPHSPPVHHSFPSIIGANAVIFVCFLRVGRVGRTGVMGSSTLVFFFFEMRPIAKAFFSLFLSC